MPAELPTGRGKGAKPGPSDGRAGTEAAFKAELLLLLRMVLADGEADARTIDALSRTAAGPLGIEADWVPGIVDRVLHFGDSVGPPQAQAEFRGFARKRRVELAERVLALAAADPDIGPGMDRVKSRLIVLLDLEATDIADPATT